MTVSRRAFLASSAAAAVTVAASRTADAAEPRAADAAELGAQSDRADRGARVDPWLEVLPSAIEHNVRTLSHLAGGRSILAVAKNNAYGLGLRTAGPFLARLREVWGLAAVRADEAFALHDAGVRKPILLMGPATDAQAADLVARGVRLAAFTDDAAARLGAAARRAGKPATVHLYVDTGMHRMGFPHGRALPWIEALAARKELRIEGVFTELTEDAEFDREQVQRCRALVEAARARGIALGRAHAASSDAIMRPNDATFLDLVRPGITVYGGYPTEESRARGELQSAYRLKARVIRVDNLAPGEGISYHRRWVAAQPTTIATLAIGHVDGYPTGAVKGCEVMIGAKLYPVVGTVSASHTVVAIGDSSLVRVGDEATLVGPDAPALHPNEVAKRSGWSEYNMFMHLNAGLARRVV